MAESVKYLNDDMKREIYVFWEEEIKNFRFYHGTNSIALKNIRQYGLVPGLFPFDEEIFLRLDALIKKAGYKFGFGAFFQKHISAIENENKNLGVFLTSKKNVAISYARRSPEMWSEFIRAVNWEKRDYESARMTIFSYILYGHMAKNKFTYEKTCEVLDYYSDNPNRLRAEIETLSGISKEEFDEIMRLFNKLWELFKDARPVVITVAAKAPAIIEECPEFSDFDFFLDMMDCALLEKHIDIEWGRDSNSVKNEIIAFLTQTYIELQLEQPIEPNFIINIEYV